MKQMQTKEKIFSGTTKTIYRSDEEYFGLMSFEDTHRTKEGKIIEISGKGAINNSISSFVMNKLSLVGIENHFIKKANMRQQLIQLVDVLPIQVNICTVACGNYVEKFGLDEGFVFDTPVVEYRVKSPDLQYPVINEDQMINFGWLIKEELKELKIQARRVHDFLSGLFAGVGLRLTECKLEFGRVFNGEEIILLLADEITPDNCRLWDVNSNEKFSFEAIDEAPEEAAAKYREVLARLKSFDNGGSREG